MPSPDDTKTIIENADNTDETYLGTTTSDLGREHGVYIDDKHRVLNTACIGPTGAGKTQLMTHALLQDIHKGYGVAAINPKGEFLDEVLAKLPDGRMDDVIYINPAAENPTPINVLEPHVTEDMSAAKMEEQKEIIVSDLIALFRRQSENWGDRFGRNLETVLRAHVDLNLYHGESNTLLDVFNCLTDEDEMKELMERTRDDVLRREVKNIHENLTDKEMAPAVRRVKDLVENKVVRNIVNAESGVDFADVVNEGKIFLVDIRHGEVGHTVAHLVGSVVISKIWSAVQHRAYSDDEVDPFYLYIDEAHRFSSEGDHLNEILSEGREYRLSCWICSQYLRQFSDKELRQAITNNCRSKVFFNPADSEDAGRITSMLKGVDRDDLKGLGRFRAVLQKTGEGSYPEAEVFDTYPPWESETDPEEVAAMKQEATVDVTREQLDLQPDPDELAESDRDIDGDELHSHLLASAADYLEDEEDALVNVLSQDGGSKPDAHVMFDEDVAHLEAEASTIQSNPSRVVTNLERGEEKENDVVFAVEPDMVAKLEDVIEDVDPTVGTRILSVTAEGNVHDVDAEEEFEVEDCPQLDEFDQEELEAECLHRDEDGFCEELGAPCPVVGDD